MAFETIVKPYFTAGHKLDADRGQPMRSPSKKHSLRFIMVCVGIGSLVLAAIKTALVAVSNAFDQHGEYFALRNGQGHNVGSFHGSRRSRSSHLFALESLNSHFFGSQRSTVWFQ